MMEMFETKGYNCDSYVIIWQLPIWTFDLISEKLNGKWVAIELSSPICWSDSSRDNLDFFVGNAECAQWKDGSEIH